MRILAGQWKGQLLKCPRTIRATSDKVRAALFNILGETIRGARVLEVCAGSGAVGLEACSRGAQAVTWIESQPVCVRVLRANLERLIPAWSRQPHFHLLPYEAVPALKRLARDRAVFDLIFLDPPYRDISLLKRVLHTLEASAILVSTGWVVVEHHQATEFPQLLGQLEVSTSYRYGDTRLTCLRPRTRE